MTRITSAAAAAAACLTLAGAAFAQQPAAAEPTAAEKAEIIRLNGVLKAQHRISGDVPLLGTGATLHLGTKYYFLSAEEAKQVLKEWGNPPEAVEGTLGIVFPADKTFLDKTWGAVVTFENAGYISDEDADKTDYNKYIADLQKGETEENAARKKAGFDASHLVGWAQPPTYDKARHEMIWARDIRFGARTEDSMNYDVRLLGRKGYVSLNLVSTMSQLPAVRADAAALAADAAFNPGSTYGDYKAGSDKKAEYGIAGLVAAGVGLAVAHKLGLIAIVALFAKKFIVLIGAAMAGGATWLRRLFKREKPADKPGMPPSATPAEEAPGVGRD
jgi:uncharacterized membrane-anchored protein